MAKKNTPLKDYSFADLWPTAMEIPAVHPQVGDLGFKIKVQGMSDMSVKRKALEASGFTKNAATETDPAKRAEMLLQAGKSMAEVAAAAVVGWPDDCKFGPYSPEACLALMLRPGADWLITLITDYVMKHDHFFPTVGD